MKKEIADLESWLIEVRRDFHMHPELGFEEFRTSQRIKDYLQEMGISHCTMAKTGIAADILGKDQNITIALRADIDALPIHDNKQCSYRSQIDGKMHACGHDAHTTILLGTAKILSQEQPPCNIRLIFQPAEETDGGALPMIQEGVLKNVDAIIGLHMDPGYPTGTIAIKYGCMNASSDMITIILQGKSGHGAYPGEGIDAIVMAAALIQNLQSIISRNIDGRESAVLTLGKIQGGSARNIIADQVTIEGIIRTLDPDVREHINHRVEQMISSTAQAFGGKGQYIRQKSYTSLINHDHIVDIIKETGTDLLGADNIHIKKLPNMGVEDFAYYLEKVQGAFFYLGCGNEIVTASAHNENFDVDEASLVIGVELQYQNIYNIYNSLINNKKPL